MSKIDENEWLKTRLDAIVQLLLESATNAPTTSSGKIERLTGLGFKQPEIARMIGKTPNFVSATIANSKKKGAPKPKTKKKKSAVSVAPVAGDAAPEELA
jgi:hypothetical protein